MSNDILISGKSFTDGDKTFHFDYDIRDIIKTDSEYIVMFKYFGSYYNVDAYNLEGKHVWNINDTLKWDYQYVFVEMYWAYDEVYVDIPELKNCIAFWASAGVLCYVDVVKKQLIARKITK